MDGRRRNGSDRKKQIRLISPSGLTVEFESIATASSFLDVHTGSLTKVAKGIRGSIHGWKAEYIQ